VQAGKLAAVRAEQFKNALIAIAVQVSPPSAVAILDAASVVAFGFPTSLHPNVAAEVVMLVPLAYVILAA